MMMIINVLYRRMDQCHYCRRWSRILKKIKLHHFPQKQFFPEAAVWCPMSSSRFMRRSSWWWRYSNAAHLVLRFSVACIMLQTVLHKSSRHFFLRIVLVPQCIKVFDTSVTDAAVSPAINLKCVTVLSNQSMFKHRVVTCVKNKMQPQWHEVVGLTPMSSSNI